MRGLPIVDESILDEIRDASPCGARWEEMDGDGRARRCQRCRLAVFNTACMSRAEAAAMLLAEAPELADPPAAGGARLYRRADGTLLTRDCAEVLGNARRVGLRVGASMIAASGLAVLLGIWEIGRIDDGVTRDPRLIAAAGPWNSPWRARLLERIERQRSVILARGERGRALEALRADLDDSSLLDDIAQREQALQAIERRLEVFER